MKKYVKFLSLFLVTLLVTVSTLNVWAQEEAVSEEVTTIETSVTNSEEVEATEEQEDPAEESDETSSEDLIEGATFAAVVPDVITKMYITDSNGNELTGDITQWRVFRLNANFSLPNNAIKAGDTTTVTIPNEIRFTSALNFPLTDASGNVVARAVADQWSKTMTITYTDYVESHSDVSGLFYFNVAIDYRTVKERRDVPLDINVEGKVINAGKITYAGEEKINYTPMRKTAWRNSTDPSLVEYSIAINQRENFPALNNVRILDVLESDGVSYLSDSFNILMGDWVFENGEWTLQNPEDITANYPVNIDGSRFTVDLGNIPVGKGVRIRYKAKLSYIPASGEIFTNRATLTSDEYSEVLRSNDYKFYEAGGKAEGYNFTISVNKVNSDGQSLEGAVFDVIRVRTGKSVGQITTDAGGQGSLTKLLRDQYILHEVTPPAGYTAAADVTVEPTDFDPSSKVASKTIINEAVVTTESPTTESPTTESPTTESPTTESPTTESPTTESPTTESPTTESPTTESPTTESPTTESPTTESPTTESPTTDSPTTESPTTEAPTTTESPATTTVMPIISTTTISEWVSTTEAPKSEATTPTTEAPMSSESTSTTEATTTMTEVPAVTTKATGKQLPKTGETSRYVFIVLAIVAAVVGFVILKKRNQA